MTPADRVLAFEAIENFRDYGGYLVQGGGRVRTGRLFRSAHHGRASEADLERLARLRIGTIVDLRRRNEREREPCRRHAGFTAAVIDNDLGNEGTASAPGLLGNGSPDRGERPRLYGQRI